MENANELALVLKMKYAKLNEKFSKIEKYEKSNAAQRGQNGGKKLLTHIVRREDPLIAEIKALSKKYIGIITNDFKRNW